ncbi:hypothetical protein IPJ72_06635 [Candidatus Peregrinibacteria bacterium]|nr:MAG: hypothetical protein IPJ72_06635 [Candidatus Peregrinibacteria bacterium]
MKNKHSKWHTVLLIWIIFASLYFVYNEWGRLSTVVKTVAQQSREEGFATAINGVIQKAQACESFNVFSGDSSVELINIQCLNQGEQTPQE